MCTWTVAARHLRASPDQRRIPPCAIRDGGTLGRLTCPTRRLSSSNLSRPHGCHSTCAIAPGSDASLFRSTSTTTYPPWGNLPGHDDRE